MKININKEKILKAKITDSMIIQEACDKICSNHTPVQLTEFMLQFKSLPRQTMLENLSCLYRINSNQSIAFLNYALENFDMTEEKLNDMKQEIYSYMEENFIVDNTYDSTIQTIDKRIEDLNDMDKVKESIKYSLASDRFSSKYVCESFISTELDIIGFNINYSPETISQLELLLRKVKMSTPGEYIGEFPTLLDKSTNMVLGIDINVRGDVLELVTSVPIVIAEKLVEAKISSTQVKNFNRLIDKQIIRMTKVLKANVADRYQLYYTYLQSLQKAKDILNKKTFKIAESAIEEHIAEMQPDVVYYDESVIEDIAAEIEDSLVDMIFDEPSEEDDFKVFENFYKLSMRYTKLLEGNNGPNKTVTKAANKVGDVSRNVANKAVAKSHDAQRLKTTVDKSLTPIVNLINNTVNKIKETDKKERTERIVTGEFRFKLKHVIKKGIGAIFTYGIVKGVAGAALNPLLGAVLGAITVYASIGADIKREKKTRKLVLRDLEEELKIVNEKIEDAKSDGNKEAKYKLMRIRSKLEHDIERVKYRID